MQIKILQTVLITTALAAASNAHALPKSSIPSVAKAPDTSLTTSGKGDQNVKQQLNWSPGNWARTTGNPSIVDF